MVPISAQYSRFWHASLTIEHGCWESGAARCRPGDWRMCGTDRLGFHFRRKIVLPHVFPDGEYVLGMSWYGGVRDIVNGFQDFYSCSYVRISGGGAVSKDRFYAKFKAGPPMPNGKGVRYGKCLASANRLGVCGWAGCKNVPAIYQLPAAIKKPLAQRAFITAKVVKQVMQSKNISGQQKGSEVPVCRGKFCCDGRCGVCEQSGCASRLGGSAACCPSIILKSGRVCKKGFRAPCVIH